MIKNEIEAWGTYFKTNIIYSVVDKDKKIISAFNMILFGKLSLIFYAAQSLVSGVMRGTKMNNLQSLASLSS